MKRILLTTMLVLSTYVMASNAIPHYITERSERLAHEMMVHIQKEYERAMINHIEIKSEITIPDSIDFGYIDYMYKTAKFFDIPVRIAFRLVYTESRFNDTITSPVGAYGFTQLMPKTFNHLKDQLGFSHLTIDNRFGNIYLGFYYLRTLYDYWINKGKSENTAWKFALGSYNAGLGKVRKYRGIPPYKETIEFVNFINKKHSNQKLYKEQIQVSKNFVKNEEICLVVNKI